MMKSSANRKRLFVARFHGGRALIALMLALLMAAPTLALAESEDIEPYVAEITDWTLEDAAPARAEAVIEEAAEGADPEMVTIVTEDDEDDPAGDDDDSGTAVYTHIVTIPEKKTKVELTVNIDELVSISKLSPSGAVMAVDRCSVTSHSVAEVAEGQEALLVTPRKAGKMSVYVYLKNGWRLTLKLTVKDPYAPSSVKFDVHSVEVNIGDTLQLTPVLKPTGARTTYTWKSSARRYATVSDAGLVTGVKEGKATITVKTANSKTATITVKVIDPYKPTAVSLDVESLVLGLDDTYTLAPSLVPLNAVTTLKWSTSNRKVATVSDGVITAKAKGKAKITVKTANGKTATCKVTVSDVYGGRQLSSKKDLSSMLWDNLIDTMADLKLTTVLHGTKAIGFSDGAISIVSNETTFRTARVTGIQIFGPTNYHIHSVTYGTARSEAILLLSSGGWLPKSGNSIYDSRVTYVNNTYTMELEYTNDVVTGVTITAK